jgi:hypothetical protein
MVNKNLNINLNSTVSLNSINYKSNQHRESFPKELDKIQLKMLQRDGMVMVKIMVLVMMVMEMMMPMKSSSMVMMMAMISPLWEGISPVDFCLPESFYLSVFSAPQRRRSLSLIPPLGVRFSGTTIYMRG